MNPHEQVCTTLQQLQSDLVDLSLLMDMESPAGRKLNEALRRSWEGWRPSDEDPTIDLNSQSAVLDDRRSGGE